MQLKQSRTDTHNIESLVTKQVTQSTLKLSIHSSIYVEYAGSECQNEVHNMDNSNPHDACQSNES